MSLWPAFLSAISSAREVTLVGPLYGTIHQPLMPTIYVDGGSRFRPGGGWAANRAGTPAFPVISIGDGDSSSGSLDEILPTEKNYSDLAFALRHLPASVVEITLLGFLGGRRDHELANLGEVHAFLKSRVAFTRADIVGPRGDRIVAFAKGALELDIRGAFSVFVLERAAIEIGGACRYPLAAGSAPLEPLSSVGLSNEGLGSVRLVSSDPCFILISS